MSRRPQTRRPASYRRGSYAHFLVLVFSICIALGTPSYADAADSKLSPTEVIATFHETLLTNMQRAQELGIKGRFKRVTDAVNQAFHLEITLRQAVGRTAWRAVARDVRTETLNAFTNWTSATYADQFDGYAGERFEMLGDKEGPRPGTQLIETALVGANGEKIVSLTYVMLKVRGSWGVYDVLLQQGSTRVSQLAKYISEFRTPVKAGLANLAGDLERRAAILLETEN